MITVEGLGNLRDGMHPVQMAIASAHGSQCGFCTLGFVMSMYALLLDSRSSKSSKSNESNKHSDSRSSSRSSKTTRVNAHSINSKSTK